MKIVFRHSLVKNIRKILVRYSKRSLKKFLPTVYITIILLGLILAGFYPFVPQLKYCSSVFGESICTPLGFFIAMIASIPGYLIVGNILKFLPAIKPVFSVLLVVLVSLIFYYFLGLLIETLKSKNKTPQQKMKIVIVVAFIILVFLSISLA